MTDQQEVLIQVPAIEMGDAAAKGETAPVVDPDGSFHAETCMLQMYASRNDCPRIIRLIRGGVPAGSFDYDRRCGLHLSCAEGHEAATKLLIEEKADVNFKDRFGLTPLDEAIRNRHDNIAELLKEHGASVGNNDKFEQELIVAAGSNQLAQAETLLKHVNVNCSDYDSRTPLHVATSQNDVEMVKLLLKNKADPTLLDRWGGDALQEVSRHASRTGFNEMKELFAEYFVKEEQLSAWTTFSFIFTVAEILLIILLATCTTYAKSAAGGDDAVAAANGPYGGEGNLASNSDGMSLYPYFQDVNVMIFVGFGYLMTFLKKNAFNSLGLTFLISAFVIQWHILCGGFFHQLFQALGESGKSFHQIEVGLDSLIFADFAAGAVLITYGALLGKVTPFQLLIIAFLEIIFFSLNENIGLAIGITDIGGSMVVHMFGAFFGLGATRVLRNHDAGNNDKNASVYHSDLFAMVGTVFLWMFWPSFNGAFGQGVEQQRVVVNTYLSLCGSCVSAFLASHILRKEQRFNMVDVQNATLAGGVAMGTAANMLIGPGVAALVGCVAGLVSVVGYVFIQPFLEVKMGVQDTCGVNNLHGIPSVIGAIAGVIVSAQASMEKYGSLQLTKIFPGVADGSITASQQALNQLIFMCITLAMALSCGALTGLIVLPLARKEKEELFDDSKNWEVPELEIPYYFDHRGEIQRDDKSGSAMAMKSATEGQLKSLEAKLAAMEAELASKSTTTGASDTSQSKVEQLFEKLLQRVDASDKNK